MAQSREQLASSLAESVAEALRTDLAEQERALLIVSGGSTPLPFFEALSRQSLEWERVDVTLADERWVDESADDSNTRLVKQHLVQNNAAKATFIPLTTGDKTPEEGVPALEESVSRLNWPASVVILGMGGDGHTASLFPDSPQLEEGLTTTKPLLAVHAPSVPQARISFSRHQLAQAKRHYIHLTGDEKRAVFSQAFAGDDVHEAPIRAFMKQPLALYWAP